MTDERPDPIDEVTDSAYERGTSDGLPVVPPTEERVNDMLECTALSPESEICRLGNRDGILTVQRLAINGVMAGCIPLHMPVLEAGARALADPAANAIQSSVSTGSWAYLFLVNGPIRSTLDINSGTGAFGPGFRSNRALGRVLGLAYRNTARIHPGEKDMGVQGSPFNAQELGGLTKQEVKEYIYANSYRSSEQFSPGGGNIAAEQGAVEPLQRRQFDSPDRVEVVVVGGSGRFDAVMGPTLGGPTTKKIDLPSNWEMLFERYQERLHRNWGVNRPGESGDS